MKKKNRQTRKAPDKEVHSLKEVLSLYSKFADLKKEVSQIADVSAHDDDRLSNLEIHINLLTRLLTTLCVEKFGIRIGVLKALVRRIEKEAVRDSQILELESLYNLSRPPQKKTSTPPMKSKDDPWEQIS